MDPVECTVAVASRWRLCYVVLFGSVARGYAGPHSDTDIAVRAGRRLGLVERGLLQGELEECWGRRVDLVVLDDWDPVLGWEALWRGRLLWARDEECRRLYYYDKARALDEVADLEPLLGLIRGEIERAFSRTSGKIRQG